jgi:TonB family protein
MKFRASRQGESERARATTPPRGRGPLGRRGDWRVPRRARAALALAASVALHLGVTLGWRSGGRLDPPAAVSACAAPAIVLFTLPPPPVRPPTVVVVGPGSAAQGGVAWGGLAHSGARASARRSPARAPRSVTSESPAPASPSPAAPTAVAAVNLTSESSVPVASADPSLAVADRPAPAAPDPDPTFEDLIQAPGQRLAAGRGPGRGGFGQGEGRTGLALSIDLSGRRVAGSRVAATPVVLEERHIACELAPVRLRAVVRLLVMRDGTVAVPRVLEPSGQQSFDACALRYAQTLRFAPGTDGTGRPIDVWIHVGITPAATNRI